MSSAILWAPLAFGLLGLFLPQKAVGWWAVLGTAVTLGLAIVAAVGFDTGSSAMQYAVDEPWISGLGVDYSLGIDGLNLFLILLTAVLWVGGLTFSLAALNEHGLGEGSQRWIFWFFAAAFLVKMPAFMLHGWMPDAYRAAPLPALIVFSGVLAKVGAYGFLRVVLPLFPDATVEFQEVILMIALASILYGSVMAFTQTNVRLIAGYSSVAQLGFITAGIFALQADGSDGAVLQMVNHGLVVAPLFVVVALLLAGTGTEDISERGGLALRAPVLAALFLIVVLATLAMPGSANFIGEFYILNGLFEAKIVFAFVAISGVAMSAYYALRLYQQTMHNRKPEGLLSREIGLRDGLILVPLVLCIVGLALYPQVVLERTAPSVAQTVAKVRQNEPPESRLASMSLEEKAEVESGALKIVP